MSNLKTKDKFYIIVPSTLLGLTLLVLVLNNYIISYLPPKLLSIYPLRPCWPNDGGLHTEGVPTVTHIQFLDIKSTYHIGEPINPRIISSESFGVSVPRIYITNSSNQTIWVYEGQMIQDNCRLTLHYAIQDVTEPPRLDKTGRYEMFTGSQDKLASFGFDVIP